MKVICGEEWSEVNCSVCGRYLIMREGGNGSCEFFINVNKIIVGKVPPIQCWDCEEGKDAN